jgi:hypothetical protein
MSQKVAKIKMLNGRTPSIDIDGNTAHLEWVVDGRILYLQFFDDDTYQAYFDDGHGDDFESIGTSPRMFEAFKRLLGKENE